jgi:type II secretory pathway pseudopilin PulG
MLALVGLLTCIAIPNFTEAKTATDIAQAKDDMRAIALGLEAYKIDSIDYPSMHPGYSCLVPPSHFGSTGYKPTLERLTTPAAYISGDAPFYDPFEATMGFTDLSFQYKYFPKNEEEAQTLKQYLFIARNNITNAYWDDPTTSSASWYLLSSAGPDRAHLIIGQPLNNNVYPDDQFIACFYDPSNGTISRGSIWRSGGTPEGRGSYFAEMIDDANSSRIPRWNHTSIHYCTVIR